MRLLCLLWVTPSVEDRVGLRSRVRLESGLERYSDQSGVPGDAGTLDRKILVELELVEPHQQPLVSVARRQHGVEVRSNPKVLRVCVPHVDEGLFEAKHVEPHIGRFRYVTRTEALLCVHEQVAELEQHHLVASPHLGFFGVVVTLKLVQDRICMLLRDELKTVYQQGNHRYILCLGSLFTRLVSNRITKSYILYH